MKEQQQLISQGGMDLDDGMDGRRKRSLLAVVGRRREREFSRS